IGQIESYGFAATTRGEAPPSSSPHPVRALALALGSVTQRFMGTGERGIRRQLLAAGMYDVEPATIVGYRLLLAVGATAFWIWAALARGSSPVVLILGAIAFGALGWMLPITYLSRRARHRTEQIERELPELIDLLVVTLEAGLSFLASLHMAAKRLR